MRRMTALLLAWALGSFLAAQDHSPLEEIRKLRLRGDLLEARELAQQQLEDDRHDLGVQVQLRLELAQIHDRFGLHHNTRPVAEALREIEAAEALSRPAGSLSEARIELGRASYFYRAEMAEREFVAATRHAQQARRLFQELEDLHGQAEAVHRLGLIHLQRRELEEARRLFDLSLGLDRKGGERVFFCGEYERHVAFVYLLGGDAEAAIPHFQRSLDCRRQAGPIDASLFAAASLASALIQVGRTAEAESPLLYGVMVAERLGSPVGKARNGLVLGRFYLNSGDRQAARIAFQATLRIAQEIGSDSLASQARAALGNLPQTP